MWTPKTVGSVIKAVTEIEMNVDFTPKYNEGYGSNIHKKPCIPPSRAPQLTNRSTQPQSWVGLTQGHPGLWQAFQFPGFPLCSGSPSKPWNSANLMYLTRHRAHIIKHLLGVGGEVLSLTSLSLCVPIIGFLKMSKWYPGPGNK